VSAAHDASAQARKMAQLFLAARTQSAAAPLAPAT